jgi:hypothetical protein
MLWQKVPQTLSMFGCLCYRPPTKSLIKASESMDGTHHYLLNSTDPTAIYLEKGLRMVNEAAQLWTNAEGNSTSSYGDIGLNRRLCEALKRILISVIQRSRDSSTLDDETDQIREDYRFVREFFIRRDCRFAEVVGSTGRG